MKLDRLARSRAKTTGDGGRGGGIRTPTRGFGDRWSAVKPTPLYLGNSILLNFLVRMVLAAEGAMFLQFQPLRHRLLVLHAGVILPLTLSALQCDLFARHIYPKISLTVPAPTVRPPSRIAKRKPLSMATGVISSISSCTLSPGITISIPSGNCATPVTSVVRK